MHNSGVNASGTRPQSLAVERVITGSAGSTFFEFDDVRVPVGNLIGQENQGFPLIMSSMSAMTLLIEGRLTNRLQP
jgi:alkylation response protein AidB-like acyl-CoA dehydrogenase